MEDPEDSSVALIIATQEDVLSHGHVLYGLVKKADSEDYIESTSRMVNVVPRKRIYSMDSVDELVEFRKELLKRPLVLQPIIQAGTGIQSIDCFFCVKKEAWVVMINQFHAKILDKITHGMDRAASCMFRGEGFILEFSFGDILKKHYYGNIAKYMPSSFAYTDCEFGDVIIRSSPHKFMSNKVSQLKVSFEDVAANEIKVRTIEEAAQERRSPVLEFIPQSQLSELLPKWVFDEVEIDESIVSTSDYHSDSNMAASACEVVTSQPTHKRPRTKNYKQFVSVDLHAPKDNFHSIPEEDDAHDSDSEYHVGQYRHFHQGSGSGRSDSSVADSGYEDTGVPDRGIHDNSQSKKSFPNRFANYDNYGYSSDEDIRAPNYRKQEEDVIITRTGKTVIKTLDKESLVARMMDESVM